MVARRGHAGNGGVVAALAAAALFGVGVPLAKVLVGEIPPLVLAALLYVGAGVALAAWEVGARALAPATASEARLRRGDLPVLLLASTLGGVVGPLAMLYGLRRLSGVVASLLLNLEAPFTILLAVVAFGEHLGARGAAGAALVVAGAAALTRGGLGGGDAVGALALVAACLAWAVDNNLTQRLSARDPVAVARAKGLLAGTAMALVALAIGSVPPPATTIAGALALGALGYGASLVLAVRAMRVLGAARQAAYFATAPFVGALAAVPLLGERLGARELAAGALMALGVRALAAERHGHRHAHAPLEHDHHHVHDAHHRHAHGPLDPGGEPHAHPHGHEAIVHEHAHVSDVHHRHRH